MNKQIDEIRQAVAAYEKQEFIDDIAEVSPLTLLIKNYRKRLLSNPKLICSVRLNNGMQTVLQEKHDAKEQYPDCR